MTGGKFVPLSDEQGLGEERRFGPEAVLLAGWTAAEAGVIRALLDEMGAEFVRTVICDESCWAMTLGAALLTNQTKAVVPKSGLPRVAVLSGMSTEEVLSVIDEFRMAGFPETIFAAAVPKSWDTVVADLIAEVEGDHRELATSPPAGIH